jgi:hypothetical protein
MSKVSMNGMKAVKRDLSKDVSDVVNEFHSIIFKLLKICKKVEPNNIDIEWLQNKLSLARDVDPLLIIDRCKDKLWTYRNEIIEKDIDFFLHNNFSQFVKNDENKTFLYTLLNLLKKGFLERSNEEKEFIWLLSKNLLSCVIRYKKLINDFAEET